MGDSVVVGRTVFRGRSEIATVNRQGREIVREETRSRMFAKGKKLAKEVKELMSRETGGRVELGNWRRDRQRNSGR